MPATPDNTITPRREIKNYQIKSLINLRYTALLCPERERKVHVGVLSDCDAARKMKDLWPFEVALRGEASNHLMLRWLKTVVVSDEEKAPVRGVRWGSGRRARAIR